MKDKILEISNSLKNEIIEVKTLEELKQLKAKYTSKSEFFISLKESIRTAENKAEVGELIKFYNKNVNAIIDAKKEELENSFFIIERENPINTTGRFILENKEGCIHPLTQIAREVMDYFDKLNYHYAHGIELEIEKYNFDILNMPEGHPAREMQDTFYLEDGKILRTQATNITARELEATTSSNFSSYSIGPVFRNDDNDATHSFQFSQIDIFNLGKDISVANLKWTLNGLMSKIFGRELATRYRPSYFPFTEPSYEVDIECLYCETGCSICQRTGWIEVLGSGMLAPQVTINAGKDPDVYQGMAAGIGVERVAMLKWSINDIREFYNNDIEFLSQFKGN